MATFELNGMRGTFDGERWSIDDPRLRDSLTALSDQWILENGGGYLPNRVNVIVRYVMDIVGGRIVEPDLIADDPELKGRIYQDRVES